ncbi:hypothetical protein J6590_039277 [Homalodisca vitripennis]|nr:hypothetical protein J6590_039277 [Homalodisca vitripennis]
MENTIVQTRPKNNGWLRSNSLKCEATAVTALATSRRRESRLRRRLPLIGLIITRSRVMKTKQRKWTAYTAMPILGDQMSRICGDCQF